MAMTDEIEQVDNQEPPQQGDPVETYYNYLKKAGADIPPTLDSFKKTLSDDKTAQQYYGYLKANHFDAPPNYGSFARTLGIKQAPPAEPIPEHQISHTPVQDIRHLQEMAAKPIESRVTTVDPMSGTSIVDWDQADVASNKAYNEQLDKAATDLGQSWGAKPETVKKVLTDFPNEPDENKLKQFAISADTNPAEYSRLKSNNDIRMGIAQSDIKPGSLDPNLLATAEGGKSHENSAVGLANAFNDLNQFKNYDDLQAKIPLQQEMIRQAGLGPAAMDKLKQSQAPLINSLDIGLLHKYWNGDDKELGLSPDQYAGLETERLFSPNKAQMDLEIIRHSRSLDESGKANPLDLSKQPYAYQRGLENVLYNLDLQGRINKANYIAENKPKVDGQIKDLVDQYNQAISFSPDKAAQLHQEFLNEPLVQEANKLEQGQEELTYAHAEDYRKYPLNFSDQATRVVKDAMASQAAAVGTDIDAVLRGAGETADNTMRWIKNTAINLAGSQDAKVFNNTKNIGYQSLNDLAGYQGAGFSGVEQPLSVPRGTIEDIQGIFKDSNLTGDQKAQKAISYVKDHFDELTVNPKMGQQNMTGKSMIFNMAGTMGQILGLANQSFLMGGAIGDASKLQQMASAFTPMFVSTQNQMYEQALKNGDEHPLEKSNLDAAIISLASLINPDIKIVKGMLGVESGLGKTIAGVSEDTWNKVLSENSTLVDRNIGRAKAAGKQLGLANLQYGLIVPTATYLANKNILGEDANLGDMIKDGVIQTNITMALPALLHGVWGGKKATEVNPIQKYSLAEAGLHPTENIDLIDGQIKDGKISEVQGHDMKMLVKHAGEFMLNTEMTKTDGTPMNEKEVSDNLYSNLRLKVLEGKLKTAAEPMKPVIEEKIHEVNKEISDLHTSEDDKQKTELNQLLHDNLDRIRDKMPTMEQPIKDAIAENRPEDVFKEIASQALETTKKDGVEVSSRPLTEEIFGKALVEKAIELSKQKTEKNGKETEANAQAGRQELLANPATEGAESMNSAGAAPFISEPLKSTEDASAIRSHTGQGSGEGSSTQGGQDNSGQNIQQPPVENSGTAKTNEQAGQQIVGPPGGQEGAVDELPFGNLPVGIAHEAQVDRAKAELNVTPPERGEGITLGESINRGKELLKEGADVGKIVSDFQKDKKVSLDDMSVVRAAYNEMAAKTNAAYDKYGPDSPQAKSAFTEERSFYNNSVKPMQTEWSKIGIAQQGSVDLDTGSVMGLRRAFEEKSGKSMTEAQTTEAKEMADKVKELDKKIKDLQKQLDEAHKNKGSKTGIKETGKALADKIRKAKIHKPDMFSAATPASLVWDGAVELTAKSVEAGATIADAISKGIEHIKNSDWYKGLKKDDQNKAEQQFTDWHNEQANEIVDLKTHFVDKRDNKFTPDEAKAIWEHTKKVMDSGKTDFHQVISQVAMDTGLTTEQVRHAISQPKGAKVITDKMYADMYRKRQVVQKAQAWVKSSGQSAQSKFWNKVIKGPSAIVTALHGSVAPITHVGGDLYRPTNWNSYFNFMLNSYKYSFGGMGEVGKATYEKAMGDLTNDPMYIMAKRAGLKIDPTDLSGDDYSKYQGIFGRLSKMGERGFNAMKPYRLEQFKKDYNNLSDQAKGNNDVIEAIANKVNLQTGTTSLNTGKYTDAVIFAPKLIASQYQRIFSEPWKAFSAAANWENATDAQKYQAKMVARHTGEMITTYMAGLAANSAILSMTGSNKKINYTHPLDSDWMKFKVSGKDVDASGGMNSSLRFIGSLVEEGLRANGVLETDEKGKPGDTEGRKILQQAANKLSPLASDITEMFSTTDNAGNPLPWSAVKPPSGKERLTWPEYFESKSPIFMSEGFKAFNDAVKESGMPKATLNNYIEGIVIGVISGATGAKVQPDKSKQPKNKGSQR